MPVRRPSTADLVRLSEQIESDRDLGWSELQQRDFAIGRDCQDTDRRSRLLCWLDALTPAGEAGAGRGGQLESALGLLLGLLFFVLGFLGMLGFLFAHAKGVVNVLWFFAVFVLLQCLLCLFSAATLGLVLRGHQPASLSLNPARWLAARGRWGAREWRRFQDVIQLGFLRYGQVMGVAFVGGNLLAFLVLLALNDFSFVWSSTFRISDDFMLAMADVVATPWAGWLPVATVDADVIAGSRYNPLDSSVDQDSRRAWWPFLFAATICYALLPRLLLWLLSKQLYARRIDAAFLGYPGVELVIRRMRQPAIQTQGTGVPDDNGNGSGIQAEGVLVVAWSDAIGAAELPLFNELSGLGEADLAPAGLSFTQDKRALERAAGDDVQLVILVVKSWEPPMSDLQDFVAELVPEKSCVVFLRPLPGQDIPRDRLEDWKRFSMEVPGGVQVKSLNPSDAAEETPA